MHYLNKLGRGPLGDATYQILKALGPVVSDKKIFPHFAYVKILTPEAGHFRPQGQGCNLNKLYRGLLDEATYKISRLYALWFQKRLFHIPYISLCKTCDHRGGAIFGPRGII